MAKLKQTSLLAFAKVSEDKHEDCNELSLENSAVEGDHGGEANAELIVNDQGAAAVTDDGEDICTADCCCIARENPNQPISKKILLCTKRIQGHGKISSVDTSKLVGLSSTRGLHCALPGKTSFAFIAQLL